MESRLSGISGVLALTFLPLIGCCTAAAVGAAGAAGAAGGIAYTDRGATTMVQQDIQTVAAASRAAMQDMGIQVREQKTELHEQEIEIQGENGDRKVVIDIEGNRAAGMTRIEVTSKDGFLDYSKRDAEQVLVAILDRL